MSDHLTVAVLGTGIMGAAMARNISRAGHEVRVWNRTAAKAEPLAADGAFVAATPAEAVTGADTVLTMLFDGPVTLETMKEAAPGLRSGAVWWQATTAGIESVSSLAEFAREHGLVFFDAPVLGTRAPAENGQLTVLAAGPEESRPVLTPLFDAVGQRTIWAGEDGAAAGATRLKLVCNSWVMALTHGTAEALALSKGLGVDPQSFLDIMAGGPMDCGYLRLKSSVIMGGDYTPSFAVDTAGKDSRLIVEAGAAEGVRMDIAAAGAERFRRAGEQGHGDEDMAASYFASFES
jgi:3-hydroxyisobutyrate dehydrogenase